MRYSGNLELISRATELLWVIARCDVEDVKGHRSLALSQLREVELRAGDVAISDLYGEIVAQGG